MFPMTVTINNPTQLNAVMVALSEGGLAPIESSTYAASATSADAAKDRAMDAAKERDTAKKAKTAKPEAADTLTTAGEAVAPEQKAESSEAKPATYDDAAKAITSLAKAKGRDAAMAVLSQFGAAKLPDVKPEDFAAVITAATEASK